MIIRCPYCEFSRSLNEQSIPARAEFVTCPKCKHRFKFRSIEKQEEFSIEPNPTLSPIVKDENHADIWDAVDALHQKFEQQIGEHVKDVNAQHPSSSQDQSFGNYDETLKKSQLQDKINSNNKKSKQKKETSNTLLAQPEPKLEQNVLPLIDNEKTISQNNENSSYNKTLLSKETVNFQEKHSKIAPPDSKTQGVKATKAKASQLNQVTAVTSEGSPLRDFETISLTPSQESSILSASRDKKKEASTENEIETSFELGPANNSKQIEQEYPVQSISIPPENLSPSEQIEENSSATLDDSNAFKPLFPQGSNSLKLRLEQNLQFPPTPNDRPSKDLGKLDEIDLNENIDLVYGAPIGNTLWESPISHGWCKSFLHTIRSVMFSAPTFFLKIPGNSGISLAFLFFLIQGYITILFSVFWAYIAKDLLDIPLLNIALTNLPFLLLLAPLALGFILIFSAGIMRFLLELCGARNVPFPLVARIVCYSTAPMILSIIPFIGPPVGALWFFIAMTIAGKRIFSLSWFSSILFTLPATFSIIAGILIFFL